MLLKYIRSAAMPFMLSITLYSCSKSSGTGSTTPPPVTPATDIKLKTDSQFGSMLTDETGKSLYFFAMDANGSSACTGGCATTWPAFYVASPKVSSGLDIADFKTISRPDGTKQTTYKGWPLYKYANDVSTGSGSYGGTPVSNTVSGDGISGVWFVAKPDYTVMLASAQLVGNDGIKYNSDYTPGDGVTLYMTDDRGLTLYAYNFDKSGKNNYTASDFSNDNYWPILQISTVQKVPSVLDKADFSSITVFGKPQLTYRGWPVYHFGPDGTVRGSNQGISVPTPGIWPVMNQFSAEAPN